MVNRIYSTCSIASVEKYCNWPSRTMIDHFFKPCINKFCFFWFRNMSCLVYHLFISLLLSFEWIISTSEYTQNKLTGGRNFAVFLTTLMQLAHQKDYERRLSKLCICKFCSLVEINVCFVSHLLISLLFLYYLLNIILNSYYQIHSRH